MLKIESGSKVVTRLENSNSIPNLKRIGIYCRVSTPTPAQLHSLSAQASFLLKYALRHRSWVVADIYIDVGSGSSVEGRPEFLRMLSNIQSGEVDMVITKSVSRFGRNAEEILTAFRLIVSSGATVFFEEQDLSSDSPDGELYVSLYGGIAQEENRQHSDNIKWGIKKKAKDGTSAMYNRPCYGYRVNAEGDFEIVQDEASVVREIYSLYIRGLSVVKIIRVLEEKGALSPTGKPKWSKRTIETILTNKKYIGTSVIYKSFQSGYPQPKRINNHGEHDVYELADHHVPIIAEEIFAKAQEARIARTNMETDDEGNKRRRKTKYSSVGIDLSPDSEEND